MALTYEPIATTTLGSAQATITFSSIPSTYTDLRLVIISRSSDTASDNWQLKYQYNSDTASNYSTTRLVGTGAAASSSRNTAQTSNFIDTAIPGTASTLWGFCAIDIFSYTGSTFKTSLNFLSKDLNGSGHTSQTICMWRSTSAITSIVLTPESGNFVSGSTATLYGIKAA